MKTSTRFLAAIATLAMCLSIIAEDVVKTPVLLEAIAVPIISKDVVKVLPARNVTRLGNITIIADIDEKTAKISWKEGEAIDGIFHGYEDHKHDFDNAGESTAFDTLFEGVAIPLTTDMAVILPDDKKLTLAAGTIIQIRGTDVLHALITALKAANALQ